MGLFERRSTRNEIMDQRRLSDQETEEVYALMRRVNRYLGGSLAVIECLKRFAFAAKPSGTVRILDVASGAGDIPQAVIDWARRRKIDIRITALDLSGETLRYSQRKLRKHYPEISWVRGSVYELPFRPHSFDYVMSSMFFHHLPDEAIPVVLRKFDEVASRGLIVNDLLRYAPAYYGISMLSRLTANEVFRFDAPLSVLRGFRPREFRQWPQKSGLPYLKGALHYAFRFTVSGEKDAGM